MGCVSFFKSNWEDIRANAALFVGFLLGNLKKEERDTISTEHACSGELSPSYGGFHLLFCYFQNFQQVVSWVSKFLVGTVNSWYLEYSVSRTLP